MADTITIKVTDSLGAIAFATFTIPPALAATTPTFSPVSGNYGVTQSVSINADPGATINYTTDGSTPTTSSPVYSTPISVSVTQTINAIANVSGYSQSAVGSATYTIGVGTLNVVANGGLPVPPGAQGVPYELILNCTNGTGTLVWSKTSGPAYGSVASLATTSALFSGTPPGITAGDTFVIGVTDAASNTGSITFTL